MLTTTCNIHSLLFPTGLPATRLRQAGGRIATDPLARLTGIWLLNSAEQTLNFHGYEHNLRNDITRHTRTDASFVDYDYDDLGQLTDAVGSRGWRSPVRNRRWSGVTSPLSERVWSSCAR